VGVPDAVNKTKETTERDASGDTGYQIKAFANTDLLPAEYRFFGVMFFLVLPSALLLSLLFFKGAEYRFAVILFAVDVFAVAGFLLWLLAETPRGP